MPGHRDVLNLPSIENLDLDLHILFAGEGVPLRLKEYNEDTQMTLSVSQILSSMSGDHKGNKKNLMRLLIRYEYVCTQSLFIVFFCSKSSYTILLVNLELTSQKETAQALNFTKKSNKVDFRNL